MGTPALQSGIGEHCMVTAASPQGSVGWKRGTVGTVCVCPLLSHRDPAQGPDLRSPPPWAAPDNSDAVPEPLNPVLLRPSPPNRAAMKKKPANGRGPDPAPPPQRTRSITKMAEVTYPQWGHDTPKWGLGAGASPRPPNPPCRAGPVALGGHLQHLEGVVADTGGFLCPP